MLPILTLTTNDIPFYAQLRHKLWPDDTLTNHMQQTEQLLSSVHTLLLWMHNQQQQPVAFLEASIRFEYVNGSSTAPVGFLEGVYVEPAYRRQGISIRLIQQAEQWAAIQGCSEFASDTDIANTISRQMHHALGFSETERVVYFLKKLKPAPD